MAVPTKVVFPAPPPTTNDLTSQQRMQLIRSTKKLSKILGSTPHLVDTSNTHAQVPMHIHLPFSEMERNSFPRASMDSISSSSTATSNSGSSRSLERVGSSCSSTSSIRSTSTRAGSTRSRKSAEILNASDSWPSRKPPMLRLALAPPLETIPASPLPTSSPMYTHPRSSSIDGYADPRYTISPAIKQSPTGSPTSPSFTIPSPSSERRKKMDRLRRKLGEGVPLDLVFPTSLPSPLSSSSSLSEKELPSPPLPTPRASRPTGRITATRDSIASDSPHHAPRKFVAPKASRPAPPPPSPVEVQRRQEEKERERRRDSRPHVARVEAVEIQSGRQDGKARLCVIVESPDEHGHGFGCSEEFGRVGGKGTGAGVVFESEWYEGEDESVVKAWSTRMGYAGWRESFEGRPFGHRRAPTSLGC